jgi:hypothetical protein
MIIECSSNVFHVAQPSGYGRDYSCDEEQANEQYQHFLDKRIREKYQKYFRFNGFKNYQKGTKRRNLPLWHPAWATDGEYEVNGQKFLKKFFAPRGWRRSRNGSKDGQQGAISLFRWKPPGWILPSLTIT